MRFDIYKSIRVARNRMRGPSAILSMATLFILAFLVLSRQSVWATPDEFVVFAIDEEKLQSGQLQLFERLFSETEDGCKKRMVAGLLLIDAAPNQVWEISSDWDSMGQYVPDVEYFKTVLVLKPKSEKKIGQSFIEGKLNIPFYSIQYTLDVLFDTSHMKQTWRLMTPEEIDIYRLLGIDIKPASYGIESIEGNAYIEPYKNGEKAIYYYITVVEYSMPLPEFLESYIAKNTLAGYLEGVKQRVESQGLYIKTDSGFFLP